MGRGMCLNLVKKGCLDKPLLVYNRTQKRSEDFVAQVGSDHAKMCTSLHEGVGSCDITFSWLGLDSAVADIYESMAEGGDICGKLFIGIKIAKLMIDKGAEFVSGPAFGPSQVANSGTLIFATAGAKSSIDMLRP
ncbi:unnamed protein product [Fusarium fujikuroi]|uniref:6-phosphogluconate dehydrogenase NADP-binding domain-containing protein n=1 Tax=Fusarium fujikuroi TaxID=5127 RepID=A0A9Q9RAE8_FUSFU|nr:unnamed protein product [Fusarium fujikuroi]VTT73538.1 unnamed protein product [Fusarium fujikuroi]VZI18665.1 unnamed protein product [Fusarium fujikuroi]